VRCGSIQKVSERCIDPESRFGSECEQYNGAQGGRYIKWYSKQMFEFYLRRFTGACVANCTERQCMDALASTNHHLRTNPEKVNHLTPYVGPQCFAHLDKNGSDYRLNANMLPVAKKSRDGVSLDAFHIDRWEQCCVCSKWRFVDEDSARLLQSDRFFEQCDSDMDWAMWLSEAWLSRDWHTQSVRNLKLQLTRQSNMLNLSELQQLSAT